MKLIQINDLGQNCRAELNGLILQESYLVSVTLKEAIPIGRQCGDRQFWDALSGVSMSHEVEKWPMQPLTLVSEMGLPLDGGRRQRVELARATIGKQKVLILDEATSAADVPTEQDIIGDLRQSGVNMVAAAHRPALINQSEIVVTIEKGSVKVSI